MSGASRLCVGPYYTPSFSDGWLQLNTSSGQEVSEVPDDSMLVSMPRGANIKAKVSKQYRNSVEFNCQRCQAVPFIFSMSVARCVP